MTGKKGEKKLLVVFNYKLLNHSYKFGHGGGQKKARTHVIKYIMAVIYGFRNKLECLSLNTRLGWKGLPGTNVQLIKAVKVL